MNLPASYIKTIFLPLVLLLSGGLTAQTLQQVDSLIRSLDSETSDFIKLKAYNTIANYYLDNNPNKSIEYLEKSSQLAQKIKRPIREANNYYSLGFVYLLKADFKNSLANYLASAKIYEKLKDSFRLSNAYMSIGNVYFQNKNDALQNQYYGKAETLILAMKDSVQLASFYNSRGTTYDQKGKFDSALIDLKKAHRLAITLQRAEDANFYLGNIGLTYKHQGKTQQAIKVLEEVQAYNDQTNAPEDLMAASFNNLGAVYTQAKQYEQALGYFNKSIAVAQKIGATTIVMENYRNMADLFKDRNNFKQQVVYLEKYHHLKDSIYNIENTNQLTELESAYQIEKKNAQIIKIDAKVKQQRSQRNFFFLIALAVLLFLIGLYIMYLRIKRNHSLLQQKNEQISAQKNELLTLNHVKDRLFSIISHDLRNPLITLRSYLTLADNAQVAAEKKQQFKRQTMQAVMHTSDMLDNLLAWAQVQIKQDDVQVTPIEILPLFEDVLAEVQAQADQKQIQLLSESLVNIVPGNYQILSIALRNILTNAIKFSHPQSRVWLTAESAGNKTRLKVTDEGSGMSESQIQSILQKENKSTSGTQKEKGSGLGLFLVIELLEKINATLKIQSQKEKGSVFIVELPLLK